MRKTLRLYTFSLSHFSEKTRWMLDETGTEYREVILTPFLHIPRTLLLSRGRSTTVPILQVGGVCIQGSARIHQWLAENRAPFSLLSEEPMTRGKILEIEKRFDRVGTHVIRYLYFDALTGRGLARMWTLASGPISSATLQFCFPLLRRLTRRAFAITPANAEKSRRALGEALDWLETEIADGRTYLLGAALTAADITVCALLSPLACPDQHPVYSREDYRALMQAQLAPWSARPGLAWVRECYRRERKFGVARDG